MPLVRSTAAAPPPAPPPEFPLEQLDSTDVDERRRAARALSGNPAAASALAGRLASEGEPRVRHALFSSLVAIGGPSVAALVAPFLHSDNAALRGGTIEMLKSLADDAVPTLDLLLDDPEADIRLLAIEVTRAWPSALAVPRLQRIIESDPHVNVCGAAVDVATEVGTAALLDPLAKLRIRFAGEQFLSFAIDVAFSRIRASSSKAV